MDPRLLANDPQFVSPDKSNFKLEGGSTRSEKAPPYHLVPPYGGRRVALRFGLGADRYGEGNWKMSINESRRSAYLFCQEAYNHMMEHARKMADREDEGTDDHLGAIGWAVEVLAYVEKVYSVPWAGLMDIEGPSVNQMKEWEMKRMTERANRKDV